MSAIGCPRCGGTSRRLLAPNYFECTTNVLINVVPAGMQGAVQDTPIYQACGHRYQQAAGSAASERRCHCGFDAVAGCVECDAPLCGQHADEGRRGGRVLCATHAAERERESTRAEVLAQERREAGRAAAVAEWEANAARALAAVADPTERMVRAIVEIRHAETAELDAMIPKNWNGRQIADWFLRVVKEPPGKLEYYEQGFFGLKRRTTPAWWFSDGPTELVQLGDIWRYCSISICGDGRIRYRQGHRDGSWEPVPGERFAPKMLKQMLEMAMVDPLDLPPRPPTRPRERARPQPRQLETGSTDFMALDRENYKSFVLGPREDHTW